MGRGSERSLLVQGWTGINHSYAMVNQYQLLQLATLSPNPGEPGVRLFTQQMPLFDPRWSAERNHSGLSPLEDQALAAIPRYEGQPVDAIYRIHTPNTLHSADCPVFTFIVTELGLDASNFIAGASPEQYQRDGNYAITPSHWSKDRLVSFGFAPERIRVIPHGVDSQKFAPYTAAERGAAREALGYSADDVVFLNVGAPIWNKGMDLLIKAYFDCRQTCKNARLLIKDQQSLYGLSAVDMVREMAGRGEIQVDDESIASIRILPHTLSIAQLRGLYNVADYYVSPYRAEGFNLPVIEAIACGTPVIVTAGGATDDFCDDHTAIRIPSTLHRQVRVGDTLLDACLQPDAGALLAALQNSCRSRTRPVAFDMGRVSLLEQFSWRRAARMLAALV